ncbi:MAG: hypothetical protein JXA25_14760 [Anaerolineales bacterium]|nr:hypothetical protein [Anaerolineales bacterium]
MAAETKTLAMRILDQHKIPYGVLRFSEDIHDGVGVALATGTDPSLVYKTLVVEDAAGGKGNFLIIIPAESELDLKRTATSLGRKKVRMASLKDAEKRTGLKVGGISALVLLNRGFSIYLAEQAADLSRIVISAGQRGINLRLAVVDLLRITGADWIDCC